jgi:SpoVK/Ycf46/Vps4 family AAA+-type ATPase
MTIEHKRSSKAEIEDLIRARYSLIWITSPEEERVEESLKRLCVEREMRLEVWSITEGFKTVANGQGTRDVKDPMKALDHVMRAESNSKALFVLRDFHPFLKEPAVVRRLRDAATELRKTKKSLVVLSPVTKIAPELEKSISAVLDWDLPNRQEIELAAKKVVPALPAATQQVIESDPTFMERVVEGALGLTLVEAENVFAKSAVRTHTFDLETILEEKKQIIRKSGLLEYYEHREEFSDVGGMEILKDWLVKRRNAFSSRARDFGLPLPKGILLIGVPGTGKSLTAKAVGALWQMPLLRLDVGKIFAGLVGSSEENIRSVIKTAEAIAPAILWIDELEKGFSGTQSSGSTDGGTTSRVFASFITWLQEKTTPVFVIATANNVHQLPPELLRKGRFDEIFFCDLPDREDRRQILDIHIRKKNRDPGKFDMDKLVEATVDYSGAELEQAVVAALYDAFDSGNDLSTESLMKTTSEIVPLAITMREMIESMREWARTRARMASARGRGAAKKEGWMARYGAPSGGLGDKGPQSDEGEPKLEL